jgi:ATPase components of various ABC-type transport systems, contain duplicated ATPase
MTDQEILLKVDHLVKHFPIMKGGLFPKQIGAVRAVDGVTFDIHRGETLGLVGESGCGKSTTGRNILQLQKPTAGHVFFEGVDLVSLKPEPLRKMRRKMQMIFQDPYASLNPRMTIGEIIGEPLLIHGLKPSLTLTKRYAGCFPLSD